MELILFALIDGRCIHSLHCGIVCQRQPCFLDAIGALCPLGPLIIGLLQVELVVFGVNNHIMNISPHRLILVSIALLYVLIVLLVVTVAPTLFGLIYPVAAHHHLALWYRFLKDHNDLGTFRIHVRLLIIVLLVRGEHGCGALFVEALLNLTMLALPRRGRLRRWVSINYPTTSGISSIGLA